MIVDDAAFMRITIKNMLKKSVHEVVGEAENGKVAIERYKALTPDIVTMDITMPEMDGLTALKLIKKLDAKAKVIMLTALGQESVVLEAIKSGARDFVVKPFERDRVMTAIHKLLG